VRRSAAGYDLVTEEGFEDFLQEIEEDLGAEKVKVLHMNDSKDPRGSEKDNHQDIGYGEIGEKGFENIVNSETLNHLPMVLETPQEHRESYRKNIEKLRKLYG